MDLHNDLQHGTTGDFGSLAQKPFWWWGEIKSGSKCIKMVQTNLGCLQVALKRCRKGPQCTSAKDTAPPTQKRPSASRTDRNFCMLALILSAHSWSFAGSWLRSKPNNLSTSGKQHQPVSLRLTQIRKIEKNTWIRLDKSRIRMDKAKIDWTSPATQGPRHWISSLQDACGWLSRGHLAQVWAWTSVSSCRSTQPGSRIQLWCRLRMLEQTVKTHVHYPSVSIIILHGHLHWGDWPLQDP